MFGLSSLMEKVLGASVVVMGIALAGLWFYHWTSMKLVESQLQTMTTQNGELQVAKASLEAQKENLTVSLQKQNKAVQDLITAQAEASASADRAIAMARANSAKWKGKYDSLLNAPRPQGDDCQALSLKVDEYIGLRKAEEVAQ